MKKLIVLCISIFCGLSFAMSGCDDEDKCKKACDSVYNVCTVGDCADARDDCYSKCDGVVATK